MNKPVHEVEYRGLTIKIYQDDFPLDGPRVEWDNLGNMICFHPRHNLGDKHEMSKEELLELVQRKDVLALPLYLLDHGSLWMRTGRWGRVFSEDPGGWDTSFVGYIYIEHNTIKKEWGKKKITKLLLRKAAECLEQEVETYNDYLTGNVWGFVIEDNEEKHIDSYWGFYGDYDKCCLKEAKDVVDYLTNKGKTNAVGQYLLPGIV